MLNRLTYGAAAITAMFAVIVLDARLSDTAAVGVLPDLCRKGSLIPMLFAMLACGGAVELVRLMKAVGLRPHGGWAVFWSVALMVAPWFTSGVLTPRYPADLSGAQWQLTATAVALGGAVLALLPRRDLSGGLADLAATWAVIIYTGFLPSFALQLRCHSFLNGPAGAWLILIFLTVVKISDIGAFFIGSAIGRHRLIPWISPKKSIEGALGGIACSVTVSLLFWYACDWTHPLKAAAYAGGEVPGDTAPAIHAMTELFHALSLPQVVVFGIVMSVMGQLGDLLESVFKRAAGAKDSAQLLPAFGGVLDIIDSPILAAPAAWFLLTCLWPVV
ncbi:MAG: phosphatidate cytidylyltransferase [Planctomycetota bacterium]